MTSIDTEFLEAFRKASALSPLEVPQDVQLRLYAYYKQATFGAQKGTYQSENTINLREAFKSNAWLQVSHLKVEDAKKLYIDLVNSIAQ